MIPLVRTATLLEEGHKVIRRYGFKFRGEDGVYISEKVYQEWLGKRHPMRIWGEFFSNAMVVAIRLILHFAKAEEEGLEGLP